VLFTDGLFEVYAPDQEIYTQALLTDAMRKRLALPAPQLFDEVVAEIRAYSATGEFEDDVCMVGLEFSGSAAAKPG
jgi:serine phosphatase RsbU (regulator of sigma subunit)